MSAAADYHGPQVGVRLSGRYRAWLLRSSNPGFIRCKLMAIECWWMEWKLTAPRQRARLRYLHDRPDLMTIEQWNEWLNKMPSDEFIALMLSSGPDVPEREERVEDEGAQPASHVGT